MSNSDSFVGASQQPSPTPVYSLTFSYASPPEPFVVHLFFGEIPLDIDYERAYEASSWIGQICVMARPHNHGTDPGQARLRSSMPLNRQLVKHLRISDSGELDPDIVGDFLRRSMDWRLVGMDAGHCQEVSGGNIGGELSVTVDGSQAILWQAKV